MFRGGRPGEVGWEVDWEVDWEMGLEMDLFLTEMLRSRMPDEGRTNRFFFK